MTPLDLARSLAQSTTLDGRALAVAIVLRGLTDDDPSTFRQGWPLTVSTAARAARYLGLDVTPELLTAAVEIAPTISDAMLNKTQSESVSTENPGAAR